MHFLYVNSERVFCADLHCIRVFVYLRIFQNKFVLFPIKVILHCLLMSKIIYILSCANKNTSSRNHIEFEVIQAEQNRMIEHKKAAYKQHVDSLS